MSLSNGYTYEMPDISTSNSDFEAMLGGQEASGSDSAIAELVSHIRAEAEKLESPANSDTHIAAAAAAVPEMTTPAARPKVRPRRLRRRMVILASVMGLLLATAGVGLAADHAAPGDPLYGLERALEKIGLNNGRAAERFDEALTLLNDGQPGLALGHAATTLATLPEQVAAADANQALLDAAVRVAEGNAPSGVEALLLYLAGAIESGIDGQEVAALAQQIVGGSGQGSPPTDPPAGPPVVPPVAPPVGPPDPPGPPASTPGQPNVPGGG